VGYRIFRIDMLRQNTSTCQITMLRRRQQSPKISMLITYKLKKGLRPSKAQFLWAKSHRYETANIKIERQRKYIKETTYFMKPITRSPYTHGSVMSDNKFIDKFCIQITSVIVC
jgi:selenophosphate synthase